MAALTAAGVLLGLAAGVALVRGRGAIADDGPPTIAVLPLDSLSSEREDQYFADGMHGELITQLAHLHGLQVIARGSVQGYRGGERDLKAIARDLGATAVLEGTVQRAGKRMRVQAHLVDPRTGHELWADRFDRDAGDVFALQTEVALQIARALGARLTEAERRLVEQAPSRDPEAYERYRRGVARWQRSMGVDADNAAAVALFEEAVARDPAFALAHAHLAVVLSEWKGDCAAARAHAERAAGLDPRLPQVHLALGHLRYDCEQDLPGAIAEVRQAVDLAPGDALARNFLGLLLSSTDAFDEGLREMDAALTLDPRSYLVAIELARQATFLRRYDLATRGCEKALAVSPQDPHAVVTCALLPAWRDGDLGPARRALAGLALDGPVNGDAAMSILQLLTFFPEETVARAEAGRLPDPLSTSPPIPRDYPLGVALAALGRAEASRAAFGRVEATLHQLRKASPGDPLLRALEARAHAGLGRGGEALAATAQLLSEVTEEQRRAGVHRFTAEIAAAAGRKDEALAALATVLSRPDGLFTRASLRVDPRFASLRGDARFAALVAPPAVGGR